MEDSSLELASSCSLINLTPKLCICGTLMKIEKRKNGESCSRRWRCSKGDCRRSKSIDVDTIFENSKLSISTTMQIIYMHCLEIKVEYKSSELEIGEHAIYSAVNTFYKKISEDK
ncbi:hypothetical protein ENBRE01_2251 [Enteropsectra breve]|nr:hypothetical protein ENBRE01_2251 [Enteropsectra breve]